MTKACVAGLLVLFFATALAANDIFANGDNRVLVASPSPAIASFKQGMELLFTFHMLFLIRVFYFIRFIKKIPRVFCDKLASTKNLDL